MSVGIVVTPEELLFPGSFYRHIHLSARGEAAGRPSAVTGARAAHLWRSPAGTRTWLIHSNVAGAENVTHKARCVGVDGGRDERVVVGCPA